MNIRMMKRVGLFGVRVTDDSAIYTCFSGTTVLEENKQNIEV